MGEQRHFALENEKKDKRWLIMVYLAGGRDITREARESLLRMKQVGSTANIHVVAQFDTGSEGTYTRRYYLSPSRDVAYIRKILTLACADVPATASPADAVAGTYYVQLLRDALSKDWGPLADRLPAKEMIDLMKWYPDRFENLILSYVLDRDLHPTDGNQGDTDAGDPEVLLGFIKWAKETYPATYKMVVIWGHGDGHSVAWDYYPTDALTIKRLAAALKDPNYQSGVDIVGFNSCSLGTIEVYRELIDLVRLGIASEGFTPKTSWPYDRILSALDKKPQMNPEEFASKIVEEYIAYYQEPVTRAGEFRRFRREALRLGDALDLNKCAAQAVSPNLVKGNLELGRVKGNVDLADVKGNIDLVKGNIELDIENEQERGGVDLSICDLAKSRDVTSEMGRLVQLLRAEMSSSSGKASLFSAVLAAHAVSQSYFNKDFTDLHDFCRGLRSFCVIGTIRDQCSAVMRAIKSMCRNPRCIGDDVRNSHGVSIFFPWSDCGGWGDKDVIARYKDLEFIKATQWNVFLEQYRALAHEFELEQGHFVP